MTVATRKFNPGFLPEDELVASFCVRTHEFESILETLRGCTGNSNQHQIVIGPRGSGKTTLLLRVAAEIGRDTHLSRHFLPIRFAEESYEVSTVGEFWLESLSQLVHQEPPIEDGPDLKRAVEELRAVQDDQLLAERCLAVLLDYSDRREKRLVLLVENLNMMFRDMMDQDAGWRLRHILQTEPRIVLLASATSRFDEITKHENALYDQLREFYLEPLDTSECVQLWEKLSGESTSEEKVRPLEILTGGSPRLLAILARFGAGRSLGDLMDQLLDLIDDNTEYLKSHIEFLPAQERRVYLALAELWKPATTKEVAERARLSANKCSAHLRRLNDRGVVRIAGGTATRKQFYLTERLYNIYYLLRRHRGPDRLVRALLRFMAHYYSPLDLAAMTALFLSDTMAQAFTSSSSNRLRDALLEQLPLLADTHQDRGPTPAHRALNFATSLGRILHYVKTDRFPAALSLADELLDQLHAPRVAENDPDRALMLGLRAALLARLEQPEDSIRACDEALARMTAAAPELVAEFVAQISIMRAELLADVGRFEHALEAFKQVDERADLLDQSERVRALAGKAMVLEELGLLEEALEACNVVVGQFGASDRHEIATKVADTRMVEARVLHRLNRPEEALSAIDDAARCYSGLDLPAESGQVILTFFAKGVTLQVLGRVEEAGAVYQDLLHSLSDVDSNARESWRTQALLELACLELSRRNYQAARKLANDVLSRDAENVTRYERAFFVRARSNLVIDPAGAEEDLSSGLAALPTLDDLPQQALRTLLAAAAELGPGPVLDLIDTSQAADLLLPLKTALQHELGLQPRVAQEVEEVAKDIQGDLAALRKAQRQSLSSDGGLAERQ